MSGYGWLIPTTITVIRGVSFLAIMYLAYASHFVTAAVLAAVMAWTDKLDGDLARGFKWESKAGAYADIIADKLFCIPLTYLAYDMRGGDRIILIAGIILFAYHVLTLSLRAVGTIFQTSNAAKTKMCVEMTAIVLCLVPFASEFLAWVEYVALSGLCFAATLAFWSALIYAGLLPDIPNPRPLIRYWYNRVLYTIGLRLRLPAE